MASKRNDGFERELERLAQLSGADTTEDRLLVYGTDNGVKIDIRYAGETLWMTQAQIGQLFGKTVSNISRHITNVFKDGELAEEGNLQKTQIAGATKPVALYSLDVIISVGYRVKPSCTSRLLEDRPTIARSSVVYRSRAKKARRSAPGVVSGLLPVSSSTP
jgi:hypothetical protein